MTARTTEYVLDFDEIDGTHTALVGGKGAQLGELWRLAGVEVPTGFVVTTDAFARMVATAPSIDDGLDRLARVDADDQESIGAISAEVRQLVEASAVPLVAQRMVSPEAAAAVFTADPVTSNRTIVAVEATFGLGEALVSGQVSPDRYTVRDGEVVARAIATKALASRAAPGGGTHDV